MSESIRQELGRIQGALGQIQKNTDQIPALAAGLQRHDETLRALTPQVEDYARTKQRAVGIGAFIALASALVGRLTGGH